MSFLPSIDPVGPLPEANELGKLWMGPVSSAWDMSRRPELTFLIPRVIRTPQVNFDGPEPSEGLVSLTSGIWVAYGSADFELLPKQGFVFLKLVLPRLKFHHLLPGLCIYTGMEGHCLLH